VVAVVLATATTSPKVAAAKRPPPAKLPALTVSYANSAMGASGQLPAGWTAVRGIGLLRLGDRRGDAAILIAAVPAAPSGRVLGSTLAALRREYGRLTTKRGHGTRLGGLPAQSVVLYTTNRRHVPIRILLAVAQSRRRSYIVEAITAHAATVPELEEAQEAITNLRLGQG
jgi:hypothetical protein